MPDDANVIDIDLNAFWYNLRQIATRLKDGTRILLVVKADAYGHGMVSIAKAAQIEKKVAYLGVSSAQEAFELRNAGVRCPILVLGVVHPRDADRLIKGEITASVSSLEEAEMLDAAAGRVHKKAKVHLELDTGMGRLGAWYPEAVWLIYRLAALKKIDFEGLYTHLSSAGEKDSRFSKNQINIFKRCIQVTEELLKRPLKYYHIANSGGVLEYPESQLNLVRPGILAYGVNPLNRRLPFKVRPVLSLKSRISFLKHADAGRPISYARTHVTRQRTRVATVPIGYSSGYPFQLSNRSEVLVQGRRCPIIGRVTMDHLMVDLGLNTPAKRWQEVTLIGRCGKSEIRVEELARKAESIPYAILTSLSSQIARRYLPVRHSRPRRA